MARNIPYTKEIASEICKIISHSTRGIRQLCKENKHWPNATTIMDWRLEYPDFGECYARAKQNQVETLVDEALEIAFNSSDDYIEDESGKMILNNEHVQRSRVKIDLIKWIACKLAPRIYGDKQIMNHDVTVKQEDAVKELE